MRDRNNDLFSLFRPLYCINVIMCVGIRHQHDIHIKIFTGVALRGDTRESLTLIWFQIKIIE